MRTIIVTGASGLLGQHLCAALSELPDVDLVRVSRANYGDLTSAAPLDLPKADYIIHAAGYGQPAKFMADPFATITINTTTLMRLFDNLKPTGRLLYISSSEIYSGSNKGRHQEQDIGATTPWHQRGAYIEAKRCGEAICNAAIKKGQDAVVARVSLAYGPGVKPDDRRVISDFMKQAAARNSITLQDGGSARRVYCYVTDAVEMLLNILFRGKQSLYNVGGVGEISIAGLAKRIGFIAGVPVMLPRNKNGEQDGAPAHVALDTSLYNREFGEPTLTPMEIGLQKTYEWHRKQFQRGDAA